MWHEMEFVGDDIERCSIINVDKDVVPRDCVDSSFPFFCEFACGTGIDPLDNKHRMILMIMCCC